MSSHRILINRDYKTKTPACDFCRSRKLRCDRPLPCTSCTSRGIACQFAPNAAASNTAGGAATRKKIARRAAPPHEAVATPPQPQGDGDLLSAVRAMKDLTQVLETKLLSKPEATTPSDEDGVATLRISHDPEEGELNDAVAHLERLSISKGVYQSVLLDDIVLKTEQIQLIPQAPQYVTLSGKPTRCIWLPNASETSLLVNAYLDHVDHFTPVVHGPTLLSTVDAIYRQVHARQSVGIGNVVLLLSIIGTVTHLWDDRLAASGSPFVSVEQAHAQTVSWITAAHVAMFAAQNREALSLASAQGFCILSFLVCNLEGVSLRYRSLVSRGVLLCRELGIHRTDERNNKPVLDNIVAETQRWVWWYLITTDWLTAARYGGKWEGVYYAHPHQMIVNRPQPISDAEVADNVDNLSNSNTFGPIVASFYFQRLRLAEISRRIGDEYFAAASRSLPLDHDKVSAADRELEQMINGLPSFLRLENYNRPLQGRTDNLLFTQAYMITSLTLTQQCKLHFAYLRSTLSKGPGFSSSRSKCLGAAREIVRVEMLVEQSNSQIRTLRTRLPAVLYGLFLACITFLTDACLNQPTVLVREAQHGDLCIALRMVENAKAFSLAAGNLHSAMTKIINKHTAEWAQRPSEALNPPLLSDAGSHFPGAQEIGDFVLSDFDETALEDLFAEIDATFFLPV